MKKIIAAAAAVALLCGCSTTDGENQLMKINDTVISEAEYRIYLDEAVSNFEAIGGSGIWETDIGETSAEEYAKNMALNSLQTIKISAMKADEYGFTLTEEELASVEEEVTAFIKQSGSGKTDKSLVKSVMTDKAKYNKIRESTYLNHTPDEADVEEYYAEYSETYSDMYTKYTLDTVMVENTEKGEELISRFNNGEDFSSLAKEYETDENVGDDGWSMEVYKAEVENVFMTTLDLEVGEITPVLSADGEYYVMLLTDKAIPTEDEVKGYISDELGYYEQQTIFENEYSLWKEDYTIEVNDELFESITIK